MFFVQHKMLLFRLLLRISIPHFPRQSPFSKAKLRKKVSFSDEIGSCPVTEKSTSKTSSKKAKKNEIVNVLSSDEEIQVIAECSAPPAKKRKIKKVKEKTKKKLSLDAYKMRTDIDKALKSLKDNEFVDSVEMSNDYDPDCKQFRVELNVNERYTFCDYSEKSFEYALKCALERASAFMEKVKLRTSESLIPKHLRADLKLFVALVELHTGMSMDEVLIEFGDSKVENVFSAVLSADGDTVESAGLHRSKASAVNEVMRRYLVEKLNCSILD